MNILDYNAETREFHLHQFGKLTDGEVALLKRFQAKDGFVSVPIAKLVHDGLGDDEWQSTHHSFYALKQTGFIKDSFDPKTGEQTLSLSDVGRVLTRKLTA
jgi:hypothetical protein